MRIVCRLPSWLSGWLPGWPLDWPTGWFRLGDKRKCAINVVITQVCQITLNRRSNVGCGKALRGIDSIDRGAIPFFTASPGKTVALAMQVVDGRANYAVSIDNFEAASITGSGTQLLTGYQPDPLWFNYASSPPNFYVNVDAPPAAIEWPAGQVNPIPYTFNMTLSPSTPIATYELEFTLAGNNFGTPSLFVDSQFFYLQVLSPGDFDSSGQIDGADFVQWQQGDSHDPLSAADLADWVANYGAAAALSAPSMAVPEPATAQLLVLSLIAVYRQRRLLSRLTRSR
jgi:hypothetical protein